MDEHGTATKGFALTGHSVPIRVSAVAPRTVRVSVGERAASAPSSYLSAQPHVVDGAGDRIATDAFAVAVTQNPTMLTFSDGNGRALLRLALDEIELQPRAKLRFEVVGEQHFYGLGEGGQQFDRLGATRRLWNYQVNRGQGADMAIPLLLSHLGYALFIDNSAGAYLEPGEVYEGTWIDYKAEAGPLEFYVIVAADPRQALGGVADLLGHATMPPRWALGYMQSSRHFDSVDEVLSVATNMRAKRLPCDAFIFLSTYGNGKGLNHAVGRLEFEPGLFADPAATLGDLHGQNFRVISHEYPVLHENSPAYAEAEANGYLLDYGYPRVKPPPGVAGFKEGQRFIDFSRPEVRSWWWRQHRELLALGIDGWWLDGGEGPPAATKLHAGSGAVLHNRFDLLRQQAFAEGEQADRPDRRAFLLCRSGGPGMQRFGAMPWSGDINTTFETFETQIRIGLNVALSGVPHWGTDIGGFYSVAPDDGELFVRWLQFGAFCSVFRAHGHAWRRHLPWSYGDDLEAICRSVIELRYRLMPYTYTLAWQAHREGLPLMRPLVLNYPNDPRVWDLGTQYLWGDDLLVAPVTRAGATHWTVYLPEGVWHDFWTHETYCGGRGVTVAAPLHRLPLFVRGGAIIPMQDVVQHDGERPLDVVTALIYPEGESSFTLYEDDGATNRYRDGAWATTEIVCRADAAGLICAIGAAAGDASLIPKERSYVLQIRAPAPPRTVALDGAAMPASVDGRGWRHDGDFLFIRLDAPAGSVRVEW